MGKAFTLGHRETSQLILPCTSVSKIDVHLENGETKVVYVKSGTPDEERGRAGYNISKGKIYDK